MSAFSTLRVSRTAALLALAQIEFGQLTDEQIEERLDAELEGSLQNVSIGYSPDGTDIEALGRSVGIDLDGLASAS